MIAPRIVEYVADEFRKETGIERHFRDSLAARVMAPTTDALLDFVGRAMAGLPLLGEVA